MRHHHIVLKLTRRCVGGVLRFALVLALAGAARADTTLTFDEPGLTPGATIADQYLDRGLRFVTGAPEAPDAVLPRVLADAGARSAPHAATIRGTSPEFAPNSVYARFTDPHKSFVQVYVGSYGAGGGSAVVELSAVGVDGTVIAGPSSATVVDGSGIVYGLRVERFQADIAGFLVRGTMNARIAIDDLSFDTPATTLPDFGLVWTGVASGFPVQIAPGASATTTVRLDRFGGSTGPITLAVQNLPPGITATVSPANPSGPGETAITVTYQASAAASVAPGHVTRLVGTPSASAGAYGARSIAIPLTLRPLYSLAVQSIEVTQGTQALELPRRTGAAGEEVSYRDPARPGVALAEGGTTVVRVFARIASGSTPALSVQCVLRGFRADGTPLDPPAIAPENGAQTVRNLPNAQVTLAQRADPRNGFTFKLPDTWTRGAIKLRAELLPPPFFAEAATPCASAECLDAARFTLKDVVFTHITYPVYVRPVALQVNFGALPSPSKVFEETRLLTPVGHDQFHIPEYQGSIDVTDIWTKVRKALFLVAGGRFMTPDDRGEEMLERLRDRADDWNWFDDATPFWAWQPTVGVFPIHPTDPNYVRAFAAPPEDRTMVAVARASDRPITSVAHEVFHLFGRPHASTACDAKRGEPWPPDERGELQGVGLDRRGYFWQQVTAFNLGRYRVIAPDWTPPIVPVFNPADPNAWRQHVPMFNTEQDWFDLMSYCVSAGGNDPDAWVSPRNWNAVLGRLSTASLSRGNAYRKASAVPVLIVHVARNTRGETLFTKVAPFQGSLMSDPASVYRLIARNAVGAVLSDTGLRTDATREDGDDLGLTLVAHISPVGVHSVEVRHNGVLLDRRTRSARAPVVAIVSPTAGQTVGGGASVTVEWQATDADADTLLVKLDYSTDDGATWKPLFFGPNRASVALPSALFSRSATARVRVRANDGFDETAAVSERFSALGAAPTVRIIDPATTTRIAAGAALYLSGEAYDDRGRPLSGDALAWRDGDNGPFLGSGTSISVVGLAPGPHTIVLTAYDGVQRAGTASVLVWVDPPLRNVTQRVRTQSSGLVFNRRTQSFHGSIKVTNLSAEPMATPLLVALHGLNGMTLLNADGTLDPDPTPFVRATHATGEALPPGASLDVPIRLLNPGLERPDYAISVFSGHLG